jgi:hypothetical protein
MAAAAAPPFEIRLGSGETDLAYYSEYGYNAASAGNLSQLAAFEQSAPGAIPKGSRLRLQIEERRRALRADLTRARSLKLKLLLSTDEILLPTAVMEYLRGKITRDDDPKRVDLDKEEFWELYRSKYREVLRDFPEVAYVMVRTGENYSYLLDGYSGQLIAERSTSKVRSDTYIRNMQRLIRETRRVVVDEFGRTLIWRTWDLGNHGFHASPEVYDRVLAGIEDRKGLIFSIKFTATDYWRYNDFNPNIGRGGVDQIVEFQCAREYEGKGAFPDYTGPEHAEAMQRLAAVSAVKGVWIWNFGGGWGGPHLKNDRWVRLNIETTARLAKDPRLPPRKLAGQWAEREYGKRAASAVADMLMLSPEVVLGFRYIASYSRNNRGWLPARNIMRDDIIRGEKVLGGEGGLRLLYEGSRHALEEALAEKEKAARDATRMKRIFESARAGIVAERGERVYRESLNTLLYLESLARVMSHYVRGMFLYYDGQNTRALAELRMWRAEWRRYRSEIPKLEGVASLYRSLNSQKEDDSAGAMEDTCEKALAALAAK